MNFVSVAEIAKKWNVSDRMVRNYCAQGRIPGAFLTGKTWNIPADAVKPERENTKTFSDNPLLNILKEQKDMKLNGGIYHKTQIELTYNSNHIEGSTLTHDQTRYIFETNTIGVEKGTINVDDVVETANHFKCVDYIIDNALKPLSESMTHSPVLRQCSLRFFVCFEHRNLIIPVLFVIQLHHICPFLRLFRSV